MKLCIKDISMSRVTHIRYKTIMSLNVVKETGPFISQDRADVLKFSMGCLADSTAQPDR